MTNSEIAFVQSLYAAFGRGEIGTIVAAMTPDASWTVTGRRDDYPLLGTWNGPKEIEEFFRLVAEVQEAKEFSPREFFAADDRVFALGHYAWVNRKSGRKIASDFVHIFTIRSGKVAAFREFTDTAQFAAARGS